MLRELSIRNAKRQARDYSIYFVTLTCTVSLMYAFNALIFSDSVKALSSMEVLPFMIVAASVLIVLVMGFIISYMTDYMLRRRSREFGIYMLSGIPGRIIGALIFNENALIGALALLSGLPAGLFLSQLLEAVILHMFAAAYTLHFRFSLLSAGLTILYFGIMLLYSHRKNRKWIRRTSLHTLLSMDRQNEKNLLSGSTPAVVIFFLSVFLGCAGLFFMYILPLGKGYDAVAGIVCMALFLSGFFLSIPAFLVTLFGNRPAWKYRKGRLVTFREFSAKIHSKSMVMGTLSVLFMMSMTFMGTGAAVYMIADKNMELSVFDIMLLHPGELDDDAVPEDMLFRSFSLRQSHAYGIYTDGKKDFLTVRNKTVTDTGRPLYTAFAEFQYDTCMRQSDYIRLREMLGYESVPLSPSSCYVHCVKALAENFNALIKQENNLECGGYSFAAEGIFCEPFSQTDTYGNGLDYIIIVPDEAVGQMKVLYQLYAAITEAPLSIKDLNSITESCENLKLLNRGMAKSVKGSNAPTALTDDVDYLSGKWADRESLSQLYAMSVCLFYLALILAVTGAAILATQVLSDRDRKLRQDCILRQLGMNERLIARQNNRQLTLLFLLPLLPALIISSSLISISADNMQASAFHLPVFNGNLWNLQASGISILFFLPLYGIYYAAARISYGRRHGR